MINCFALMKQVKCIFFFFFGDGAKILDSIEKHCMCYKAENQDLMSGQQIFNSYLMY